MALKGSSEGRSHPRHGVEEPLPSTNTLKSERSLAFKQWAQGRCYRCLARDHRVSSCRDLFRCIRCRRPGHRERHCPHRFPSPTQHTPSPTANPRHPQPTRSWAHIVVASSPNQLCTQPSPPQSPSPLRGEDLHARYDRAPQAPAIFDLQSILTPLLQSLHSELQQHIITHLENLVRPLIDEISAIKLWLARLATHLKRVELPSEDPSVDVSGLFAPCAEPPGEHTSVSNMAEIFSPSSPVWRSPMPSILASIVEACAPADSLVCEDTCAIMGEKIIDQPVTMPLETSGVQDVTPVEDIVLVEDASDDEETVSQVIVENPIYLITIEDALAHSMTEVTAEVSQLADGPSLKAMSSPSATTGKEKDVSCPPVRSPSPPAVIARRRRKSYDRSSLRRSTRLAQHNVLNELGIVGKDGKLNDNAIQDIVGCLKNLLPPDLLKPLMELKGRAFWDLVAEVTLPLLNGL